VKNDKKYVKPPQKVFPKKYAASPKVYTPEV